MELKELHEKIDKISKERHDLANQVMILEGKLQKRSEEVLKLRKQYNNMIDIISHLEKQLKVYELPDKE